jgi:hypothetical protein
LRLVLIVDQQQINSQCGGQKPMALPSRTVFAEELQFCWIVSESVVSRAIEGHPFLTCFLAFFRDHCGFTFGDVESVEDCILELALSFYPNAGIEDWSEILQDNVNLIFTKLRRKNVPFQI